MIGVFSRITNRISKNHFSRSILVLAGGTAFAQGIGVAASPLLSRLYSPEDFAAFGVYLSLLSILLVISSLRYELAIPLPKNEQTARALLVLSLISLVCMSCLCFGVVVLFGDLIVVWTNMPELQPYLLLLPLGLFCAGCYQVFNYWAVRKKSYASLSKTRIGQSVVQISLQLLLGFKLVGPVGLLCGDVGGRLVAGGALMRMLDARILLRGLYLTQVREAAREYIRFPKLMTSAALCNSLALQAPFILFPALFTPFAAGLFFFGQRILVLPASLINRAVNQVFFGEAAGMESNSSELQVLSLRLTLTLLAIYLPLYGGLSLVGRDLFTFIFGANWAEAGYYAQILAPMVLFWSIASPLSGLLVVGNRLSESLVFTISELLLKMLSIFVGAALGSIITTLMMITVSGLLLCWFSTWRFLRVAKVDFRKLLYFAVRIVMINIPFLLLLYVVAQYVSGFGTLLGFVVLIPLGGFFSLRYLYSEVA